MASTQLATCPHCQVKLKAPANSAGKKIRCPKCDQSFALPDADDEAIREPAVPRARLVSRQKEDDDDEDTPRRRRRHEDNEDEDDEQPRRRKSRPRQSRSMLPWLILGGAFAFMMLAGGIVATVLIINANKKEANASYSSSNSSSSPGQHAGQSSLVGVWEVVKSDDMSGIDLTKLDKNSQIKMTVEFTKDGKFSVKLVDQTGRAEHPVIPVAEGTYVLDGSKFTTTQLDADNKERKDVETIKSLTDTELIMVDEKGKTDILKRASR